MEAPVRKNLVSTRGQDGKWVDKEVTSDELLVLTKNMRFIGHGDPSSNATMLVKYASFSRDGGYIPGTGSFA